MKARSKPDEVYVVAGHKGNPAAVQKRPPGTAPKAQGRARARHAGKRKATDPWFDQRGGQVVMRMLSNVQHTTIQPISDTVVAKGSLIYMDEYDIYARLPAWGYGHETVCHALLRPHRGISQEKPPAYLGFFEFVHNARQRGKTLIGALIKAVLSAKPAPSPQNP